MNPKTESLRKMYPPGTRIELINMDDPYAPVPPGTKGTVVYVDDAPQIHMKWDNGQGLAIAPFEDSFRKIEEPEMTEQKNIDTDIGEDEEIAPVLGL